MPASNFQNSSDPPFVVVLAGGSGERFWPLSRKNRPKQLLKIVSKKTLLEETVGRLQGVTTPDRILILTNKDQEDEVRRLLKDLPKDQIIAEPAKRDTAAAVALAAGWIARRNPTGIMVILPADHVIQDAELFRKDLEIAVSAAEETQALVTIGITPSWACPSFGYIELGGPVSLKNDSGENTSKSKTSLGVYEVSRFREKPAPDLAQFFLEQGNFRWNAGMFVWSISAIICEFSKQVPEFADFIHLLKTKEEFSEVMENDFRNLPKISIDYAVMEKANKVLCVQASFDWDDVGTWTAVSKYLKSDSNRNASNCVPTVLDAHENIIFSETGHQIALLGVSDLIIVHTADATLVSHREEAEKIKLLLQQVPEELQ